MCENEHRDQDRSLNPESFPDRSTVGTQLPSPRSPKPLEEEALHLCEREASWWPSPQRQCARDITSREGNAFGLHLLKVQLKYDHCLENSLFLSQMSFLSVLNLKANTCPRMFRKYNPTFLSMVFSKSEIFSVSLAAALYRKRN